MRNIVTFSGGKDSQAVCIWALNNLENFEIVFCDTNHEAAETYKFILEFESQLGKDVNVLKSKKYKGFFDLAKKKGRFPSFRNRFCTTELKVIPMIDYILSIDDDLNVYQGIRWQESRNRSQMKKIDNFFQGYIDGKFKYRKKDVFQWIENNEAIAIRPIISWDVKKVFEYISFNGYKRNPLYDKGYNRVGCFPCVMCSLKEITNMIKEERPILEKISDFEKENDQGFFSPDKIPYRYCTKEVITNKGKKTNIPTTEDVVKYLKNKKLSTLDLFDGFCQNPYVQCE